jgi:Holliday junction resolvase RusA-like endonuclease
VARDRARVGAELIDPLLDLVVVGLPQPQGSKRHVGGGVLVESNAKTLMPWRSTIAFAAADKYREPPSREALRVTLAFSFPRPSSHFGTGRNEGELRGSAPAYKTTKPDLDKLVRAALDALTGIVFVDDAQVAELLAWKDFGSPRVWIVVEFADIFARPAVEGSPIEA